MLKVPTPGSFYILNDLTRCFIYFFTFYSKKSRLQPKAFFLRVGVLSFRRQVHKYMANKPSAAAWIGKQFFFFDDQLKSTESRAVQPSPVFVWLKERFAIAC